MIRKFLLLSFTLGSSLLFIFQLTVLQLFNSDYTERSLNNAIQERPIYPTRGLIYDRNRTLWVANKPVYDLMIVPENMTPFDTLELTKSLKISKNQLSKQIQDYRKLLFDLQPLTEFERLGTKARAAIAKVDAGRPQQTSHTEKAHQ